MNHEVGYVTTPDELQLISGAGESVHKLNKRGIITCVISNQSGVARGYLTEEDLIPIHLRLEHELARYGGRVDRIYYCPHHPTEGKPPYNLDCECRKPKPGMIQRGARELGINLTHSFVVGDSIVDMEAGNAAGTRTILVQTGYGKTALEQCASRNVSINHVAPTIVEAVDFILETTDGEKGIHE